METLEIKVEKRGDWFVARSQTEQLAKSKDGALLRRIYRARPNYTVVTKWS